MLDREQLQDELAAGADGELVGVQEGAQVGAGHGEGLDELGAVGARLAGGLHLGEDHLDVLLGKARGREAGLGQRTHRRGDVVAQPVAGLLGKLASDGLG